METAKSMIGIGAGSQFSPVKAGLVEDSDEEEQFDTNYGEETDIVQSSIQIQTTVADIVQELDDLIDIEAEQDQINKYMVMDEAQTNLWDQSNL